MLKRQVLLITSTSNGATFNGKNGRDVTELLALDFCEKLIGDEIELAQKQLTAANIAGGEVRKKKKRPAVCGKWKS